MITVRTENVPAESASVNTLTTLAAVTVRLDILTLQMRNPRLARTECNWFATATRTKHRKLGGLNNRGVCLTALKARSLRSRCLQAWFPLRSVEGESPSFWWFAGHRASRSITPALPSCSQGILPACVSLYLNFPFRKRTLIIWIRSLPLLRYDLILTKDFCKDRISKQVTC